MHKKLSAINCLPLIPRDRAFSHSICYYANYTNKKLHKTVIGQSILHVSHCLNLHLSICEKSSSREREILQTFNLPKKNNKFFAFPVLHRKNIAGRLPENSRDRRLWPFMELKQLKKIR